MIDEEYFCEIFLKTQNFLLRITGAAWGALSGAIAGGIGYYANMYKTWKYIELAKYAAHGVRGGLVSLGQGDSFQSGFLAGSFSTMAGNDIILAALAGGTAAKLGGGKFMNGAISSAAAASATGALGGGLTIRRSLKLVKVLAIDMKAFFIGQGYGSIITLRDDLTDISSALYHRKFSNAGISILKTAWNTIVPKYDWTGGSGWGADQYYNESNKTWSKSPLTRIGFVSKDHDVSFDHLQWVIDAWSGSGSHLPTGPIGMAYQILGTGPFAVAGGVQRSY